MESAPGRLTHRTHYAARLGSGGAGELGVGVGAVSLFDIFLKICEAFLFLSIALVRDEG